MADVKLADYPARLGDKQMVVVDHTGPASYTSGGETIGNSNNLTGISTQGLSGLDFVDIMDVSVSGNYTLATQPTGAGSRKTAKLLWFFSGVNGQGLLVTQNVAGTGMTPGTKVSIAFAGGTGSGAAGTVTVLTATTIQINVTNPGVYTVAPTATISGTGGTPATLTVALAAAGSQVTAGVNLSSETVRLRYQGR